MAVAVGTEHPTVVSELPRDLRDQARRAGGGWLDEVVGNHPSSDPVPLSAIKGSWRLDANGELTGEFMPNPHYGRRPGVCPLHAKRR
jgi:hypothetical protein